MAVINAGWLTDFKDIKFAPKTLFSQVYVDNPETGSITDLNSYFTTFLQKLDDKDLQVDLTSNDSVKFKNPGAIGVTGILDVPNGGTGLGTVTQHALLIGNGTSALTLLPSAAGFLVSKQDGTAPLYSGIKGSWANLNSQTEGPTFYISFDGDAEATRYNMGKIPLADGSTAGVVSTSAQTFAGGKTFAETAAFNKDVGIVGFLDVANGAEIANGLNIVNGYISGIVTPTADDHAANKVYVDVVQTNLNNLSNNIVGGTNTSGQTHHTRLNNLETRMTEAEGDFDTLTTYLGGYTDESTKAFFILDKDNNAIAYFNEKGLTVTEIYLDGSKNKYKNISLSSYFEKVDQLEVDRGTIYSILGETSVASGKDHKSRLNGHDTAIATINDLNLRVALGSDNSVKVKNVNNDIGVDGILPVKHGGTGLNTLPQYDLMYGDGTNTVKFIAHDTTDTNGVKFLVNNPNAAPSYKTLGVNYTAGTEVGATYNIQIGGKDTGANFSLPAATVGQSGVVTTAEQTFSGKKIFSGQVAINGSTTIAAKLTAQSGIDVNSQNIENVAGMTYSDAERFYFVDKNNNTVAYVDSTGVSAINFISKNSDNTVKYDMNAEFAAVNNKINTNYTDIRGSTLYVALGTQSTTTKFSDGAIGVNGTLAVANGGTGTTGFADGTLITYDSRQQSLTSISFQATSIVLGTKKTIIQCKDDGTISAILAHSGSAKETIVLRDASGNFSAETITATLSGNASTASKWKTARTITLGGDTSGSVTLDGSDDVTLDITVANNSHTHTWSNISDRTTCSISTSGSIYAGTFMCKNNSGIKSYLADGTTSDWMLYMGTDDKIYLGYNARAIVLNGAVTSAYNITGSKVYGAVWNDYAEYRMQTEVVKPGYCVVSNNSGQVSKTTRRYQACDGIVSDTFGFAIGETDKCKTPLAVAGRVLAYCEGDRQNYQAGDTVCAGPDGKVCKMTREEIQMWPDRIVGIVSEIPEYATWGTGNVKVNGRIWIKIK